MQQKIEKAKLHRDISTGTMEHRFEVLCKDRSGRGIRRDRVVRESLITVDGKAFCSCMKPKLLYLPCSHLIAACAESALLPGVFVSPSVGCGCRRVQCDQIAGGVTTLVVWLHHVQQHSWQLGR